MTRAAATTHYSVSTISRLIAKLEHSTGAKLVVRRNGRTFLTANGLRTVALACPILCATGELENGASDSRGPGGPDCPAGSSLPCAGFHGCVGRDLKMPWERPAVEPEDDDGPGAGSDE